MLIKYQPKLEHMKCVPLIPTTDELKKLKLDRSQVQLLPGINEVTDNEWEVIKVHLVREIERGEISTVEKNVGKSKTNPGGGSAHNLKNMPAKDAAALVGECLNPDTLTKWYKEETREEIRLCIVEKMKELNVELPKFTPNVDEENTNTGNDEDFEKMTVAELTAYAAERGIPISGNKAEIIAAIKEEVRK